VREAWRSLVGAGQLPGHAPTPDVDNIVASWLWLARALPVAIDVLAGLDLYAVRFEPAVLDVLVGGWHKRPLCMVGWRRDDELAVEVLVAPAAALDEGNLIDAAVVRVSLPFRLMQSHPGDEDITAEDLKVARDEPVRVRRFSVGKS